MLDTWLYPTTSAFKGHTYVFSICPVIHCTHTCFLQTTCASSHVGLKEKDVVITSRSPEAAAPVETAHPAATPEGSAQRTHRQYNCEHSENYTSSQKSSDYHPCLWAQTDTVTAVRCVLQFTWSHSTNHVWPHSPVDMWLKCGAKVLLCISNIIPKSHMASDSSDSDGLCWIHANTWRTQLTWFEWRAGLHTHSCYQCNVI